MRRLEKTVHPATSNNGWIENHRIYTHALLLQSITYTYYSKELQYENISVETGGERSGVF